MQLFLAGLAVAFHEGPADEQRVLPRQLSTRLTAGLTADNATGADPGVVADKL